MATAVSAAVPLPSSKSTALSTRTSSIISPERVNFTKVPLTYRNVSNGGKVVSIRAQVTTEAPAKVEKVSKKVEEGVITNKFRPKDPYIGKCLLNTKITGDDAPGETWHMVFSTEGEVPYKEGQSIGVIADGVDKNGKPHKLRLYSIASSALGDFGDSKTVSLTYRNVSNGGKVASIRAQVTTEAPAKVEKVSKKVEEGVITNKFRPKDPYIGKCLLNTKITGDDAPGETWHMIFSTEGEVPYKEGQSIGIIADGVDKNGKPHKLRLYSIASSALGDFGDSKTVSLCVKRLVYTNDQGEVVKGVCSNFLCDLKPGADVKITGPVGKEMLMPKDPNATIIMLATGTGIAPFRSFLWKMFFEEHEDYKFNGLAWLFLGVPTSSSLLYKEEFEKMKEKNPDNFRLDFAVSREQTNDKGEKMYIQTRMAQYAKELWELLKKDNTFVYMCGLKGMEKGIDDIMVSLAAKEGIDWIEYKRSLKRAGQWNVEVY